MVHTSTSHTISSIRRSNVINPYFGTAPADLESEKYSLDKVFMAQRKRESYHSFINHITSSYYNEPDPNVGCFPPLPKLGRAKRLFADAFPKAYFKVREMKKSASATTGYRMLSMAKQTFRRITGRKNDHRPSKEQAIPFVVGTPPIPTPNNTRKKSPYRHSAILHESQFYSDSSGYDDSPSATLRAEYTPSSSSIFLLPQPEEKMSRNMTPTDSTPTLVQSFRRSLPPSYCKSIFSTAWPSPIRSICTHHCAAASVASTTTLCETASQFCTSNCLLALDTMSFINELLRRLSQYKLQNEKLEAQLDAVFRIDFDLGKAGQTLIENTIMESKWMHAPGQGGWSLLS